MEGWAEWGYLATRRCGGGFLGILRLACFATSSNVAHPFKALEAGRFIQRAVYIKPINGCRAAILHALTLTPRDRRWKLSRDILVLFCVRAVKLVIATELYVEFSRDIT